MLTARRAGMRTDVHADAVSVARALLCLATAGTLLANPPRLAVAPTLATGSDAAALAVWQSTGCHGLRVAASYCVAPAQHLGWVHLLLAALLLVAGAGYRPRLLALPTWWTVWSVYVCLWARDGGDRVQQVLALLLVVVSLTDRRRWAWSRLEIPRRPSPRAQGFASWALALATVQVVIVYGVAGFAKLQEAGWRDGSSLYYWGHNLTFGLHGWASGLLPLLDSSFVRHGLAWTTIALELSLAAGVLVPRHLRRWLLVPGFLLHLSIALFMGLSSFALTMCAALVLYGWPLSDRRVISDASGNPNGVPPAGSAAAPENVSSSGDHPRPRLPMESMHVGSA